MTLSAVISTAVGVLLLLLLSRSSDRLAADVNASLSPTCVCEGEGGTEGVRGEGGREEGREGWRKGEREGEREGGCVYEYVCVYVYCYISVLGFNDYCVSLKLW